jgi:hypothetical protein
MNAMKKLLVVQAAVVAVVALAVAARGDDAATSGAANATLGAKAATSSQASAEISRVRERGLKVSAKERAAAETKLSADARKIDADAGQQGEATVAGRLAGEFQSTADAMMAERTDLKASWGDLTIAHALAANAKTDLTVADLAGMHADGMGWGQIAAGLGLNLGETVSAIHTEGKVAGGQAKAGARAAVIHGEGAKAGVGVNTGLALGRDRAAAGATAGAHAAVSVPKVKVGGPN